jgi:hypothetical protein
VSVLVSITAHNRLHYLIPVIESWQRARGIDDTHVHFQVEPVNEDVILKCKTAPFKSTSMEVNAKKLGALSNPHAALRSGFDLGANFVVVGEDDSIVTADALEFFNWAAWEFESDPSVMAVCSFQYKPMGPVNGSCFRDYFASVVWGTWRNRWDSWIDETWGHTYAYQEWDYRFLKLCEDGPFRCLFPCVSRSQHIGQYDGVHMKPHDYERMKARLVHDGSPVEWRRP